MMKVLPAIVLGAAMIAPAPAATATKLQSVYAKITDGPDCAFEQSATEENDSMYDCPGPVSDVRTLLHRGADWDHLYLTIDGQSLSLWEPMVAVGSWSGVGNKRGIVEWLFAPGKPRNRARLKALIIRFEGTVIDMEGNASGTRSELAVFDLTAGNVCWKGNYRDNAKARAAVNSASCKAALTPKEASAAD